MAEPVTAAWTERKRAELRAKLDGTAAELAGWRRASAEGAAEEKHHTQIRRIVVDLQNLIGQIRADVGAPNLTVTWPVVEENILDVHRIWGFFRVPLITRLSPDFRPFLDAADEFAWACYAPARSSALAAGTVTVDAVREPPLVCLTAEASPYSLARGASYAAGVTGLSSAAARRIAHAVPVPVIGLPWSAVHHLPDLLVVGHEVGHHVEDDFALTGTIATLIADADAAWSGWAGEVFADVYGVLCGGAGFAAALGDFLLVEGGPATAADGDYPPVDRRLALVLATLNRSGNAAEADALAARWAGEGQVVPADPAADAVARALLDGTYPAFRTRLQDVVSFRANAPHAEIASRSLGIGVMPPTRDVRTLLSGAALAFLDDPAVFAADRRSDGPGPTRRVLDRVVAIREAGVRHEEQPRPEAARPRPTELYDLLAARPPAPDDGGGGT